MQSKQTYDIFLSRQNVKAGDTASIYAKIQNYSNVDVYGDIAVRFYLGDPDSGGELIVNMEGQSEVVLDQVNAREPVMAVLNNWIVPGSFADQGIIFAVVDPGDMTEEVHENNNKAWGLINQGSGLTGTGDLPDGRTGPDSDRLVQVYPNPASQFAEFTFELKAPSMVSIHIIDLNGRHVHTLQDAELGAGMHTLGFDTGSLEQGIYMYLFTTEQYSGSGRLVIMR